MADIGEARLRITATDASGPAFDAMKGRVSGLMNQFSALNGVLGGFGAALSVGAIAAFVKNTLDAAARLDDMAEATGASVEELSRLSQIAKIGGHDLGTVETAMLRLTKAVSDGSKVQGAAFEAIGLSIKEMQALKADQQIETLAKRLAEFEDGSGKAAVGVALFGKAWKDIAPLLVDIAEMQDVQGRLTAEQAAQAEHLEKSWARLGVQAEELGKSLALGLIDPVRVSLALIGDTAATVLDTLSTFGAVVGKIARLDFSGAQFAKEQFQARSRERDAAVVKMMDEIANPTGSVVGARRRNLAFTGPDPEAEAAKKAELRRLAGFAAGLEEDAMDRQRAQMREEDRLIAEQQKQIKMVQDAETKYWVEKIEREQEFEAEMAMEKHRNVMKLADEQKRAQEKAADESRRAWERQFDIVSESLTDALMRGFESGEDFAQNFVNTLKNMFQTLVLRPVIQAIVQPVAAGITGLLGFGGSAFASGIMPGDQPGLGGGGLGDLLGLGTGIAGIMGGSSATMGAAVGNLAIELFGAGAAKAGFALGSALPYIGVALGAASLLGLGKSKKSPAVGIGAQGTGTVGLSGLDLSWIGRSQNASQEFSWPTFDHLTQLGLAGQAQQMVTDLFGEWSEALTKAGLDTGRLEQFRAPLDFLIPFQSPFEPGIPARAMQAFEEALQGVTQSLTEEFGPALQAVAQRTQLEASLAQGVRGLPGALGITGLEAFQQSLAVSETLAPLDRIVAARSLLGQNFGAAMGGDLTAVNAFPGMAQQLLTIGRDVFASGPQFAQLFTEVNRQLQDVLGRQRDLQADILKDIDVTILQASNDQIAELRKGFTAMVTELAAVRAELRKQAA